MASKRLFQLTVNGEPQAVAMPAQATLSELLRDGLSLTGTKNGCDKGDCGACTVLLDGAPILSCIALAADCEGRSVVSIEGLAKGAALDPVQEAFDRCGALQCGFCQSGMMISARALLDQNPRPDEEEIRRALSGNLCRCTGYTKIIEAVQVAAGMRPERATPSIPCTPEQQEPAR